MENGLPKGIKIEGFTAEGNLILTNSAPAWPDTVSHKGIVYRAIGKDANEAMRVYVKVRDILTSPPERTHMGKLPEGLYTLGTDNVGNLVLGMQADATVEWPETFDLDGIRYVGIPCKPNTMRVYAIAANVVRSAVNEPQVHDYDFYRNHHTGPTAQAMLHGDRQRILEMAKQPDYDVRNVKVSIQCNGFDLSPQEFDAWVEDMVERRVARMVRAKDLHSIESAARRRVINGVRGHFDNIETSITELLQVLNMHRESLEGIGRMYWDHKEQSELARIGCFSVVMPKALEKYMAEPSQQWRQDAMLFFIDLVRNTYQNVDEYGREKFDRLAENIRAQLEAHECEQFDLWLKVAKQGASK